MTYQETLHALLEETKETTIFAMPSYGDGTIGIGFRRVCCGSDLKDPVVDGVYFMLCADAVNNSIGKEIETTRELWYTPNNDIIIWLRANSFGFPTAIVELGRYRVCRMQMEAKELAHYTTGSEYIPSRIRLDIERIS